MLVLVYYRYKFVALSIWYKFLNFRLQIEHKSLQEKEENLKEYTQIFQEQIKISH